MSEQKRPTVPVREILLALVMLLGSAAAVHGVALFCVPAAWIVGGLLLGAIGFLFLAEVGA